MVKLRIPVVGSGSTLSIRSRSSPSDSFHDENSGAIQGNLRTSLAQFRPRMIMKRRSSQRDDHETANLHYQEEYAGVLSHGAPSRRFRLVGRYLDQRYNNQDSAPLLSNVPQFDTRLEANNVFNWLHDEAPSDVLPRILLFAGPQTMVTLSTLNRSWNSLVMTQHIWKTACEELGKWSSGEEVPRCWVEHYKKNLCVPVDCFSVESAFEKAGSRPKDFINNFPKCQEQRKNFRILLRPGTYVIRDSLMVHALQDTEITIETVPRSFQQQLNDEPCLCLPPPLTDEKKTVLDYLKCRSSMDGFERSESFVAEQDQAFRELQSLRRRHHPQQATIVLKTRKPNQPIIHVRCGVFRMNRVTLAHECTGTDIWNGNAAIHVQPPCTLQGHAVQIDRPNVRPTCYLSHVDIASNSGRGVVVIDGGAAHLKSCHIHHCAATGVYIGAPSSMATMERTDILRNGTGSCRRNNEIIPGHSGMYLEQGKLKIRDCNISHNALTGLSVISRQDALLVMENSDLVSNGNIQLEMPPAGTLSYNSSVTRNNRIAQRGVGRTRSGLVPKEITNINSFPSTAGQGRELTMVAHADIGQDLRGDRVDIQIE